MSGSVEPAYLLALTTGLLGGFGHCIGMCGPLVAACSLSDRSGQNKRVLLSHHLLYHAGRIATYGLIGAVMGLSGSFLNIAGTMAGLQNAVAVLAGILMVVMGLNITGLWGSSQWIERHNSEVLRAAQRITSFGSTFRYAGLGLVLGLLPCGLSYTIFVAAAGSGGIRDGLILAVLFGLGTLPALLAFGAFISLVSGKVRGRIYRTSGLLVICMGIYYVWRGIELYAGL